MASIVYDGVLGNGDLFAGMKFFILQRVPMRNTWIDNIKSNGGEVVPLENQADMLIADRARPSFAPADSFTWQYIQDSVKSGELQDKEKYRIHSASCSNASPAARTTLPVVGGSRPNKTTRTPYTQADDDFLLQWVAKAHQTGMALLGKKVYEQLATVNPRHTAQSWQDRYKKQHQGRQLPAVSLEGPAPVDEPVNDQYSRPLGSRQVDGDDDGPRRVPELVRRQLSRSQQAGRQAIEAEDDQDDNEDEERHPPIVERFARHAPKVVEGQEFSQADHDLLASEYEAILDIERKGKSVIQAWSAFSKGHGRHTSDEWYNYFQTTVKPQMEKKLRKAADSKKAKSPVITVKDDDEEDVEELPCLGRKIPSPAASKKSDLGHTAIEEYKYRNERGESMFLESDRDTDDGQQAVGDQDMDAMDLGMSQHSADEVPVPVLRTKSPIVSSVPRASTSSKPSSISKRSGASVSDKRGESVAEDKAAFLEDLRTIARATHKQIEPRQEVCGIQIQLYDLWNAVNNRFEGLEDVDARDMWSRVATRFGFNISKHPDVAKELRNLYTSFLVKVPKVDSVAGSSVSKAAAANVRPTTEKQRKIVATGSTFKPFVSPSSHSASTRTMATKSQAKSTPAPLKVTPKSSLARKLLRPDPHKINGNDGITIRSLPERTAGTTPSKAHTGEPAASVDDYETAQSEAPLMQLKTANDYNETSTEHTEGADEETFTQADLVMLAKLVDFAKDSLKVDIQCTGSPICGRWVSLPTFRKVVNKLGGYNTVTRKKLWKQVAINLGYSPVNKYPGVAKELQEAYEEVLEDYDEYRKRVREVRRSSGRQELQRFSDEDSGIAVPHTSPRQAGSASSQKRGRNLSRVDSPASIPDTFKRRRVDRKGKGKEIGSEVPGTPEHIYNSSMMSQEASVVKDSQVIELSSDSDSDETEAYEPIKRPVFQKAAPAEAPLDEDEPETQEFSFVEEESPSKQLNSEAMAPESDENPVVEYFRMCDAEGYSREVAVRALSATSMSTLLAPKIVSRMARGPIPDNIKGVWTSKDDDILLKELPVDHPDMVKLRRKHGSQEIEDRLEYYESLGEAVEDE